MANSTPLKTGTVLESQSGRYTILGVLGTGGFGITYLVEGTVLVQNIPVKVRFALKEHFIASLCDRDPETQRVVYNDKDRNTVTKAQRAFVQEATRLRTRGVEHTNIVRINEVFEANNTAYYVMEHLEGDTLAEYIKSHGPMSPTTTFKLFRPIIDAVAKLHDANITHYDIKPGNIILARTESRKVRPVLIDFGLSRQYDDNGTDNTVSRALGYSVGYSPIEQYAGIRQYTPQADVYSLAASIYFCLTGQKPAGADQFNIVELTTRLSGFVPQHYIQALVRAMSYDKDRRTSDAGRFYADLYLEARPEQTRLVTKDSDNTHYDSGETRFTPEPEPYRQRPRPSHDTSRRASGRRTSGDDSDEYSPSRKSNAVWWVLLVLLLLGLLGVGGYMVYVTYIREDKPKTSSETPAPDPETPFEKALHNYTSAGPIIDGLAMVGITRDTVVYNSDGSASTFKKNYYGFIDEQGRVVVPCKYTGAEPFKNGFALVNGGDYEVQYDYGQAKMTFPPRYGIVDKTGKEVVAAENGFCKITDKELLLTNDGVTKKVPLSEIYNYREYLANKEREEKTKKLDKIIRQVENIRIEPQYLSITSIGNVDYDDSNIRDAVYKLDESIESYNDVRFLFDSDDYWTEARIRDIQARKDALLDLLRATRSAL